MQISCKVALKINIEINRRYINNQFRRLYYLLLTYQSLSSGIFNYNEAHVLVNFISSYTESMVPSLSMF